MGLVFCLPILSWFFVCPFFHSFSMKVVIFILFIFFKNKGVVKITVQCTASSYRRLNTQKYTCSTILALVQGSYHRTLCPSHTGAFFHLLSMKVRKEWAPSGFILGLILRKLMVTWIGVSLIRLDFVLLYFFWDKRHQRLYIYHNLGDGGRRPSSIMEKRF